MRRSRCWGGGGGGSGIVCVSRESRKIGKGPRKSSRTLKVVFNVNVTLMSI